MWGSLVLGFAWGGWQGLAPTEGLGVWVGAVGGELDLAGGLWGWVLAVAWAALVGEGAAPGLALAWGGVQG